jgi:hypothetical protein
MFDENKVIAKNGKMSYAFIIKNKKYEYFVIEDGLRTGPFKDVPTTELNIVSENRNIDSDDGGSSNRVSDDEKIEIGNNKKHAISAQYCKTINNKLYIVFNGKNFGPYDFVAKMRVSADKKEILGSRNYWRHKRNDDQNGYRKYFFSERKWHKTKRC